MQLICISLVRSKHPSAFKLLQFAPQVMKIIAADVLAISVNLMKQYNFLECERSKFTSWEGDRVRRIARRPKIDPRDLRGSPIYNSMLAEAYVCVCLGCILRRAQRTRPAHCQRANRPHEETQTTVAASKTQPGCTAACLGILATSGRSYPSAWRVSTLTSQRESGWAMETVCIAVCQRHSWAVSWAAELRHNTRWVRSISGGQSVINSMSLCLSRLSHLHNDAVKTEILLNCRFHASVATTQNILKEEKWP